MRVSLSPRTKRGVAPSEALYVCHDVESVRWAIRRLKRPVAVVVDADNPRAPGAVRQIQDALFAVLREHAPRKARKRAAPGRRVA